MPVEANLYLESEEHHKIGTEIVNVASLQQRKLRFKVRVFFQNLLSVATPAEHAVKKYFFYCLQTFRERKTHKHKQICGIVPGLGGCQFFSGSFLMGKKRHINKITPKIPGQSREKFVYVFFCLCVFFAPLFWAVKNFREVPVKCF